MKADNLELLQLEGWKTSSAAYLLSLNDEEARLIELKLSQISTVSKSRVKRNPLQIDLAQCTNSSQSRIAKTEVGGPTGSLDLIV